MKKLTKIVASSLVIGFLATGCSVGGGDSSSSSTDKLTIRIDNNSEVADTKPSQIESGTGFYIDAPVKGLGYECGILSGFTDSNGTFKYQLGRDCIFKIGSLKIREVSGSKLERDSVIIQETDPKVAQLLLSLDKNPDSKLIEIDSTIAKELQDKRYDKHISEIDVKEVILELKDQLEDKGILVEIREDVTLDDAKRHLLTSYNENLVKDGFTPTNEKNRPILTDNKSTSPKAEDGDMANRESGENGKDLYSNHDKTPQTPENKGSTNNQTDRSTEVVKNNPSTEKSPQRPEDESSKGNQIDNSTEVAKNTPPKENSNSNQKQDSEKNGSTEIAKNTPPEENSNSNQKQDGEKNGSTEIAKNTPPEEEPKTDNNEDSKDSNLADNEEVDDSDSRAKDYSHIPKGRELTDAMAIKFLNMATFGATPELVQELKSKGVVAWVDEQLNMAYNEKKESILRRVIKTLTTIDEAYYGSGVSVEDWIKDNNDHYFNKGKRGGPNELSHHYAKVFDATMRYPDQLRQRVAYALSQIIVVSQSNDNFFTERGEALSYYYDILQKRAFGNYADLLYDISMSPAMATFLTYANNRKEYIDPDTGAKILPDENYGREIMQLFTIGLYQLNMDGYQARVDGKRVPTYTQEDVNNLSRVFTGLGYPHSNFGTTLLKADTTHPLSCFMEYHDSGEKKVLGTTLPSGQNCEQDVRSAINLLMSHPNVAPFIAKKLIMRLTKSNPKSDYIARVAEAFANSSGSLKETVRAVLLDSEIWENIKKDNGVKIKEPYLAFTGVLRALDAKPLPYTKWINKKKETIKVYNDGFFSNSLYDSLGQWPTASPTVFNFYDDEFVPDDYEFKVRGFVAPELEIITTQYNVAFNNTLNDILAYNAVPVRLNDQGKTPDDDPTLYSSHRVNLSIGYKDIIDLFKKNGFGKELDQGNDSATKEKLAGMAVDYISKKLIGKTLSSDQRDLLINRYKNAWWINRGNRTLEYMEKFLVLNWIKPIIVDITHTDNFMVQ